MPATSGRAVRPLHSPKDPVKVRAGRAGARRRWGDGPPRVVHLGDLSAPQREIVLSVIALARAAGVDEEAAS